MCSQPFCSAQTERGRPEGRPLHCLARVRLNRCNRVPLGEVRSQRGDDPVCRTRRLTMRHWITSFRLLDEDPQYNAARSIRKAGRRSAGRSGLGTFMMNAGRLDPPRLPERQTWRPTWHRPAASSATRQAPAPSAASRRSSDHFVGAHEQPGGHRQAKRFSDIWTH